MKHTPPLPRDLSVRPLSGGFAGKSCEVAWQGQWNTTLHAGSITITNISGVDPEAFARRIVQCVNAHDELVAALRALVDAGGIGPESMFDDARAALVKAGIQ